MQEKGNFLIENYGKKDFDNNSEFWKVQLIIARFKKKMRSKNKIDETNEIIKNELIKKGVNER